MRLLPLLLLVLLTACGGGGEDAGGGLQPAPGDDALIGGDAMNELVVVQDLGDGSAPQEWTLRCDGAPTGTHPQPEAACEHLAAVQDPFAPLPTDLICTEVYGGPQTAEVSGVWDGEPVELALSRRNGCEISQWDSLGPLLPGPVGVPE